MIINNGANGGLVISDTNVHNGRWEAISIIEAAVFNVLCGNVGGYASITFPVGFTLYGLFTKIDLASGKVLAYNKVND